MKFNVKPSDCRFVVNENKRTVVCIYEGCESTLLNFLDENTSIRLFRFGYGPRIRTLEDKLCMPNRFIGVATCGEDDEWNEETGKLIAFSRMKDKLNKSFFKRAQTYIETVDKWLNETVDLFNSLGVKLEKNAERRHNLITSLVGEEPSNEDN